MNKYISYITILLFFSFIMITCSDSYMGVEQVNIDSTRPDKVIIVETVPMAGALEIHFSLPKGNEDITEVVASYYDKNGKMREFSVSRYSSKILVEGFTGTDEVTVELISVDSSGNKSDVTYVKESPLLSSVELAFKSLNVTSTFGGVKIEWQNPSGNLLAIHVLTEDNVDKYETTLEEDPTKIIYTTDSLKTFFSLRPYDARVQKFGFQISDKWGNRTDTLILSLTPLKEERLDYNRVVALTTFNPTYNSMNQDYNKFGVDPVTGIKNDATYHNSTTYGPKTFFDGQTTAQQAYFHKFIKNYNDPDPVNHEIVHTVYSTFDLKCDIKISRFLLFQRTNYTYHYNRSSPKRFRFWGTDNSNPNWSTKFPETWTLIGEYVGVEPSDRNNLTPEEVTFFMENNEFLADEDNVNPDARPSSSFRYLRIEWLETYNKNEPYYTLNELQMFGDISTEY